MAHPYHHSLSSVRKWGGSPFDYLPLHSWFDQSKAIAADFRHRALRRHVEGIFMLVIWTGKPASPGRVPYLPLSGVLESTAATHA